MCGLPAASSICGYTHPQAGAERADCGLSLILLQAQATGGLPAARSICGYTHPQAGPRLHSRFAAHVRKSRRFALSPDELAYGPGQPDISSHLEALVVSLQT